MKERGDLLATGLVGLLLFFWLRFLFHADPRFPGSLVGSGLGIAGSLLMVVPLAYSMAKRLFGMRGSTLRPFLTLHIYAGIVGPILVLLHTGHKFDNPLGVLLTMMTLIVVLSGFVGRSLLQQTTRHLREKQEELARFQPVFDEVQQEMAVQAERTSPQRARRSLFLSAMLPWVIRDPELRTVARRGVQLTRAMAVLEVSVMLHEQMRRWFKWWMRFHLTLTTVLYLLLVAHVVVVTYYGLRWLPE
jgi:hypothetical protein